MSHKNKVIVSGVSLLDDATRDDPSVVIVDFASTWLFTHPSTLLWADEIIVSPTIYKNIANPKVHVDSWAKIARIFFEVADKHGLVSVRDPRNVLPEQTISSLATQVDLDRELLLDTYKCGAETYEESGRPGGFCVEGTHYCGPRVHALYISLALARLWDAHLLLDPISEMYLNHYLGLENGRRTHAEKHIQAFSTVFEQHLPEVEILPPEAYQACLQCSEINSCEDMFLVNIEKKLGQFARYREYDELSQMKEVFAGIVKQVGDDADADDIALALRPLETKLRTQIRGVFPRIQRWSNLATIVSIPVAVAGLSTGQTVFSAVGAGIAGISQVVNKSIEIMKSKNKWVCFRQEDT